MKYLLASLELFHYTPYGFSVTSYWSSVNSEEATLHTEALSGLEINPEET